MSLRPRRVIFSLQWPSVESHLKQILCGESMTQAQAMALYSSIYQLCTPCDICLNITVGTSLPRQQMQTILDSLCDLISSHSNATFNTLTATTDHSVTRAYADAWVRFNAAVAHIDRLFDYFNRILQKQKLSLDFVGILSSPQRLDHRHLTVHSIAMEIWRERVVDAMQDAQHRLRSDILSQLGRHRSGQPCDADAIRTAITSFIELGKASGDQALSVYQEEFETEYLQQTREYYRHLAAELAKGSDMTLYIRSVAELLQKEQDRCVLFYDESSHDRIMRECECEVIGEHLPEIQAVFESMLKTNQTAELLAIYKVLSRVRDGLTPVTDIFQAHVANAGKQCIQSVLSECAKDPRVFVDAVIKLHTSTTAVIHAAFSDDVAFVTSMDKAFRSIMNHTIDNRQFSAAETLAKYSDYVMKKTSADADLSTAVVVLFKYIDDKDVFQKLYGRLLAKRLIYALSASMDSEEICGQEYTSKLSRMITDIQLSADLQSDFTAPLDFAPLILMAGTWPLSPPTTNLILPSEMSECIELFMGHYGRKHSGRRLNWLHHLSRGEIRCESFDKRYEIQMSTYQMVFVLAFNDTNTATADALVLRTGLSIADVQRSLKPLVELQLLTEVDGVYSVNSAFQQRRVKLKVSPGVAESEPSATESKQSLEEDRKFFLQALIVRVMKARKEMTLTQLIQEIISASQNRFVPSVPVIKKCVEMLLDKQYIERVPDQRDTFRYIA